MYLLYGLSCLYAETESVWFKLCCATKHEVLPLDFAHARAEYIVTSTDDVMIKDACY